MAPCESVRRDNAVKPSRTSRMRTESVTGCPPYDPSQQEMPDPVLLLVPVWTLSLNENSTHPFYGFFVCFFHGPAPQVTTHQKR